MGSYFIHRTKDIAMLKRVEIAYEFCVDAETDQEALDIFRQQHTLAIADERCGVVRGPSVSNIQSSLEFEESTLDEVPLGATDFTLRERLERGETD